MVEDKRKVLWQQVGKDMHTKKRRCCARPLHEPDPEEQSSGSEIEPSPIPPQPPLSELPDEYIGLNRFTDEPPPPEPTISSSPPSSTEFSDRRPKWDFEDFRRLHEIEFAIMEQEGADNEERRKAAQSKKETREWAKYKCQELVETIIAKAAKR